MGKVTEKLNVLNTFIPEHVTIVAVSKTKPNEAILDAYESGHRDFGENKVQEMLSKFEDLPKDIRWHMIGHLQRNKVKMIVPFVHLIHGVDSVRLLNEINKRAAQVERKVSCLLQVHIAEEDSKFGFDEAELDELLGPDFKEKYDCIHFCGLMGMATNTDDKEQIRKEFAGLKKLFDKYAPLFDEGDWTTLSMGMSGDFALAIEQGSNMVRIGSAIFGERNYH